MGTRQSVSGRRSVMLYLAIAGVLLLAVALAAIVFVIAPERERRQQAEAQRAQATATEEARLAEVERAYQAGIAFAEAGDWNRAADEFAKVIALEPDYKDASAQLAEARRNAEAAGNATATTQARAIATMRAQSTVTAQSKSATATPSTPTYHLVSLSPITSRSMKTWLADVKQDNRGTLLGIPFELLDEDFYTQHENEPSFPTVGVLSVSIEKPKAIFILLASAMASTRYRHKVIGRIELGLDNDQVITRDLVLGENIRDDGFARGDEEGWISNITDSSTREAWRYIDDEDILVVDMLTIRVPERLQDRTLKSITIEDVSEQTVDSLSPGLHIFGITVAADSG